MKNHENYPEESVEIFGKDTVFVEGFSKIIEYQSETVKIKYKNEDKIITESGILKEAKEDYIILELENEIKKTIKIKDIIKARLNC